MTKSLYIVVITIVGICISGCDFIMPVKKKTDKNDVRLASVEGHEMYLSDVIDMISADSPQDSLAQLNGYIESWLHRTVLLAEAEENFPQDIDIEELVEDYKSSLLIHNYRESLIKEILDTIITTQQEEDYYQENKDQYLLAETICKAKLAKVSAKAKRIEQFYRNWKRNDSTAIKTYLDENQEFTFIQDTMWHTVDYFLSYLPKSIAREKDFSKPKDLQKHHDDFEYFIKITKVKTKNEIPPLSYIREKIRKVIIHQRKKELLEKIEKDLYRKYFTAKKVKVYAK